MLNVFPELSSIWRTRTYPDALTWTLGVLTTALEIDIRGAVDRLRVGNLVEDLVDLLLVGRRVRRDAEPAPESADTGFGDVEGCEIMRVEAEDACLEFVRCAPSCPHGEVVLLRPDQAERFKR
jgi:hypothetical protein